MNENMREILPLEKCKKDCLVVIKIREDYYITQLIKNDNLLYKDEIYLLTSIGDCYLKSTGKLVMYTNYGTHFTDFSESVIRHIVNKNDFGTAMDIFLKDKIRTT